MKQVFKYASLLFVAGALLVTSCKKKSDDPTPVSDVPTCAGGSVKTLAYTVTDGNPYGTPVTEENGSVTVSKCDGSYKITIDMTHGGADNLSAMYVKRTMDGGKSENLKIADLVDSDGDTWKGNSSSYSLKAPGSGKKTFKLTLTFPVRAIDNGTDAYVIWFTRSNGLTKGSFGFPKSMREKGPLSASFNYGTLKIKTNTFTANVGTQQNSLPSYINAGGGEVSTVDSINVDAASRFADINMLFYVLDGTLANRSNTTPALVSPDERANLGYTTLISGGASTQFTEYAGSFDTAGETELNAIANATGTSKIAITVGKTYTFKTTYSGRTVVGLVKINSITDAGTAPSDNRTGNFTFKVLNVNLAASAAAAEVLK